jgi:hypothetical protein
MEEEIKDTSGFYKKNSEGLMYAPNFVFGPYGSFTLKKESKDEHQYPVDGWYWFDSEEEAKQFLN